MRTLSEDLTAIKNVEDTLIANKVARFAYTDTAYANNDADGVDTFNINNEQNIPNPTTSVLKVNSTVLDRGYRAQASSITRMLVNHFFGRVSYNLNKINDNMSALVATLRAHAGTANGFATLDSKGHLIQQSPVGSPYVPIFSDLLGAMFGKYLAREWEAGTTTPASTNNSYPSLGQYVVGENGFIVTRDYGNHGLWWSEGGGNWTKCTGFSSDLFVQCFTYKNGLWVCATTKGCWWSEDGKAWTQGTGGLTSYTIETITYANGLWLCGCYQNGCWWSEDGKAWTRGTGGLTPYTIETITWANGLWLCGGNSGMTPISTPIGIGCWKSIDGKAWTQESGFDTSLAIRYIGYANGLWVAGTQNSAGDKRSFQSEDGETWVNCMEGHESSPQPSSPLEEYATNLLYAEGVWVMTTYNNVYYCEVGETLWYEILNGTATHSAHGGGLWLAWSMSNICKWSEDGVTWTECTGVISTDDLIQAVYANGLWVGSTEGNKVVYSEDGKYWRESESLLLVEAPSYGGYTNVAFANGEWLCVRRVTVSGNTSIFIGHSSIKNAIHRGDVNLGVSTNMLVLN